MSWEVELTWKDQLRARSCDPTDFSRINDHETVCITSFGMKQTKGWVCSKVQFSGCRECIRVDLTAGNPASISEYLSHKTPFTIYIHGKQDN